MTLSTLFDCDDACGKRPADTPAGLLHGVAHLEMDMANWLDG